MSIKDKKTSHPQSPCPFCGSRPTEIISSTDKGYQVGCINCGAKGPLGWTDAWSAIQAWDKGDSGHKRHDPQAETQGRADFTIQARLAVEVEFPIWLKIGVRTLGDTGDLGALVNRVVTHIAKETGRELASCSLEHRKIIEHECLLRIFAHCDEHLPHFLPDMPEPTFDGFVYFIEAQGLQRIKIGYSKNPDSRIKSLQTGSPVPLVELVRVPGSQETEINLHKRFGEIRLDGEWFHATKGLLDYIEGLKK